MIYDQKVALLFITNQIYWKESSIYQWVCPSIKILKTNGLGMDYGIVAMVLIFANKTNDRRLGAFLENLEKKL